MEVDEDEEEADAIAMAHYYAQRTYKDILDELRENDPEIKDVCADESDWPMGYGQSLGEAIQNNTVISTIWLTVNDILDLRQEISLLSGNFRPGNFDPTQLDSYSGSARMLLQYIRTSAALQHVVKDHLRNLLVVAVALNPHVLHFKCEVWIPPQVFVYLLSTSQSLTHLYLQVHRFDALA
jgi:hypothetical protein